MTRVRFTEQNHQSNRVVRGQRPPQLVELAQGHAQVAAADRSLEPAGGPALDGHEPMFPRFDPKATPATPADPRLAARERGTGARSCRATMYRPRAPSTPGGVLLV